MKTLKYILLSTVTSLIVITILGRFAGPWIERPIQERLKEHCATCEFHTSGVELTASGFKLLNVRFTAGKKGGQRVEIEIPAIKLHPNWKTLIPGPIKINEIGLVQPLVTFLDQGDSKSKDGQESHFLIPALPALKIVDGRFLYIRDVSGTHAEFILHKINADIQTEVNRAYADVSAQIGTKGRIDLAIDSTTKNNDLVIHVDMKAKDQDFKDLSRFFEPNAGVKLEGTLTAGHAISKLVNRKVSTTLLAEFKDFKLEVNKMYDRNDIQTFFTNLAAAVGLREKNINRPREDKIESVEAEREPGESIVSLILRSWKLAALEIAK